MSSQEHLARLMALHPAQIDLSLKRMWRLLSDLGNPHRSLPPVIHLAGTNGKGSTLSFLQSALKAAGYRVHSYTSPHLVHFHERIVLDGIAIGETALITALDHVLDVNAGREITFFEATTAAAFLAFNTTQADIVLLETGLGGRLDATNVIPEPLLSIITPISIDHKEYLGETLSAIATEKAGIIRPHGRVLLGEQPQEALSSLLRQCQEQQAKVRALGVNLPWGCKQDIKDCAFYLAPKEYLAPALQGAHQCQNAALAMAALDWLEPQFTVSHNLRQKALQETKWPARLQYLDKGRLVTKVKGPLWLDGGHNLAAAKVLSDWCNAQDNRVNLVLGMLKGKDAQGFLHLLIPYVKCLRSVTIPNEPNAYTAEELAKLAQDLGLSSALPASSLEDAFADFAKDDSPVLICGSLYLAGYVLERNEIRYGTG